MKKGKFERLSSLDGRHEQDGWIDPDVPGLIVSKVPAEKKAWETWSIYHVASGRYVADLTLKKRADAEELMRRIGPLTDWTQDYEALRGDIDLRSLVWATEKGWRSTPE
jgi:hypothetical protein